MRYEIERRAMATAEAAQRVVTPAATLAARQEHSQSQLQGMWALLERTGALVLPKCQMGEAVQCFFNQWRALLRHPKNCQRHIDNQVAERALHSLAIGRNNWPLLQTKRGGWTGAAMASRFLTARTRGIDPKTYIRDVLLGIGSETDATPHSWQHHFAAEVEDQR